MIESLDVLVIGSANLDYIVAVEQPPRPGETILARSMTKLLGGKGANQAVAAAKMGAPVRFIACVGDDDAGVNLLRELREEGVDTTAVEIAANTPTGLALVSVFDSGENSITVVPGANFSLQPGRVRRGIAQRADSGTIVVMQAEVRGAIIDAAVAEATASDDVRYVLNLAPYRHVAPEVLAACDPLVVNQSEAAAMVGFEILDVDDARRAAEALMDRVRSIIITLGAGGAWWSDGKRQGVVEPPPVNAVVDTTGAGDAFLGALVAELAVGASLEEATGMGVRGGSFSVERFGAQASYPTRSDLEDPPTIVEESVLN